MPRPTVWLAVLWLLAGCADVLGIEERKVDTGANYPADGYAGCRPGNCGGCLEVHREVCQRPSLCAEAGANDDCAECVCTSCEQQVIACTGEAGCSDIWECLRETRCELSERAGDGCLQACGSTIQASGGVSGAAFRAAAELRSCAAASACSSCLAPLVQQSARECTQANGCQCASCFDQCLCSGERFGECQRLCADDDAPSAVCTQDDDCAGCNNCFDSCACGGATFEACSNLCTTTPGAPAPDPDPNPTSTCDPSTSCVACDDCTSQCTCSSGDTTAVCEQLCAPPAVSDQCVEGPRGVSSSCEGCQSCIADCTCTGQSIESCRTQCQEADCCGSPGSCSGSFSNCICAQSASECFAPSFGSCEAFGPCEVCACQQCPGELGMCIETDGCQPTFDCMRASNCEGSACLERCRGDHSPQAFAFAEALWACYRGSECSCGIQPSAPVTCPTLQGDVQCEPFVGNGSLQACCSASSNTVGAALNAEQALVDTTNPCGLGLQVYVRDARACEPRTQPNPPRFELLETCPSRPIARMPYSGALLKGCCRSDHTCGYFDDITGLGCLSAGIFGDASTACN